MMSNKEIEKWLEKHGATREDFEKFNLSYDDMKKIITDEKGYIREKLGVDENKLTKTVNVPKINMDLIKEIVEEIEDNKEQ